MKAAEKKEETVESLTLDQFQQLQSFVNRGLLEIEFQGEDLVLLAIHEPERIATGTEIATAGKISLRKAICASLRAYHANSALSLDDGQNGGSKHRIELLALAGRLREAARFLETKAEAVLDEDWDVQTVGTLKPE